MSKEATLKSEAEQTSLSFQSITDGMASRDIPKVKFVEDIEGFSNSFDPPASVELMIGAFSDLFGKMKAIEGTLAQRCESVIADRWIDFAWFVVTCNSLQQRGGSTVLPV